jgi:hypothetical protein
MVRIMLHIQLTHKGVPKYEARGFRSRSGVGIFLNLELGGLVISP